MIEHMSTSQLLDIEHLIHRKMTILSRPFFSGLRWRVQNACKKRKCKFPAEQESYSDTQGDGSVAV